MSKQTMNLPDNPQIEVIKSGKTGLFTNYIFKAIPLAFDESMSYYECLCGLLDYLKNVIIPTVNNNADAVAELQALYEQLRSYVDNYFTNLDVQEEINNKLDKMVEDGTLQEIIASYLNSKAIFGYDTVASMKQATNLINGSYARTLGYYSKNDGGGATYKVREITNQDVVDESFIIALNDDNLVGELILNNEINVLQLGAHNDNSTNCTTIFQKAIDYVYNLNYQIPIFVPTGKYKLSSLNIRKNCHIKGAGIGNTILSIDNNVETNFISITESDAYFIRLEQFTILGNRDTNTCPNGIYIHRANATADPIEQPSTSSDLWLNINSIRITGMYGNGIGSNISGGNNMREMRLNNIVCNNCLQNGFLLVGSDNHYSQLTAWACRKNGFEIHGSSETFVDCKAFGCGLTDFGSGWYITGIGISLTDCWAQENQGHGFYIDGLTNSNLSIISSTNGKGSLTDNTKKFAGIYFVPDKVVQRLNIQGICSNGTNKTFSQDYGISLGDAQGCNINLGVIDQNTSQYDAPKSYVLNTVANNIMINSRRISTAISNADFSIRKDVAKISFSGDDPDTGTRHELFKSSGGALRIDTYVNNVYKSRPLLINHDTSSNRTNCVFGTPTGTLGFFGKDDGSTKKTLTNPAATDATSAVALLNEVVDTLISYGLMTR